MNLAPVEAIAKAVLYEGYILYPYRASNVKNQQRWTFGGVYPRDYARRDETSPCEIQTECLVQGGIETGEIVLLQADPRRENELMLFPDQIEMARHACSKKQDHTQDENQRPSGEMTIVPGIQLFGATNKIHGLGRLNISQ